MRPWLSTLRKRHRIATLGAPTYRFAMRNLPGGVEPRIFVNSIPKAGTHLVASLLVQLPHIRFSGVHTDEARHVQPGSAHDLRSSLGAVRIGQYATGHHPYDAGVAGLLEDLGFRTVFVVRDPRDIVVSHAHYVTRGDPHHELHDRYANALSSFDERLMASITGFAADSFGPGLESIGQRIRSYAAWVNARHVRTVRFEDLVGSKGGGSDVVQRREIGELATFLDRPLALENLQRVAQAVWQPAGSTFRTGLTGGWRECFKPEHLAAFDAVASDSLLLLGYSGSSERSAA